MVATDSRMSDPPHIQPPMAHVPSATRETTSCVFGIPTNSVSTVGVRSCVDRDMNHSSCWIDGYSLGAKDALGVAKSAAWITCETESRGDPSNDGHAVCNRNEQKGGNQP